jgi:hypothetical protein
VKWKRLKLLAALLVPLSILAWALFQPGCGGASGPAPPAEIPTPLKFVSFEGLKVDLTAINPVTPSADISATKALPPGTDVIDLITFGPGFFDSFVTEIFQPAITGIQEIVVPGTTSRTCYANTVAFSKATGRLEGTHNVKLDFSKFDYNESGSADDDGCSGNSRNPPICVRFWVDDRPYLAGIFRTPPTYGTDPDIPTTLGEGDFKIITTDLGAIDYLTHYRYGQPADQEKDTEYWFRILNARGLFPILGRDLTLEKFEGHSALKQVGPAESAFKSLNISTQWQGQLFLFDDADINYIGQFVQGVNFWGGSVNETTSVLGTSAVIDERDICASLPPVAPTGIVVAPELCQITPEINLLPGDTPFVSKVVTADVAFPSAEIFPDAPPASLSLPQCQP